MTVYEIEPLAEAGRLVERGFHDWQAGRYAEAELRFREAIAVAPDYAHAQNNLGRVRQLRGDVEGALAAFRRALELDPGLGMARRNLAVLLVQLGRVEESLELFRAEMLTDEGQQWVDDLIADSLGARDLTLAGTFADIFSRIRWSTDWYPVRRDRSLPPVEPLTPAVAISLPKLQHDIDQFRYLQRHGVFGDELTPVIAAYERTMERLASLGPEERVPLDDEAREAIGAVYNRMIHVRDTPRVARALSDRWNPARVESQYLDYPPGVVVVDDFLSEGALDGVRRFCHESTIWVSNRYTYGRLGAFIRDGFNCPLLLQIAEELRAAMPRVIGDRYPLRQLWGFKNNQSVPADATTHADFAAVNVNFWITPDEANLDPQSGGMVVYEVDAPPEWDFYTYNGRADLIHDYLRRHQARRITIPYRANRAVIFNSDLFHCTDALRFRPGYEHRRVNITMLYGQRENDAHYRQLGGPAESNAWRSASFSRTRRG